MHYDLEQALKIKSIISQHLKIKTMKVALMALAIEISLARMFVSSWGSAVAIIMLYCTLALVIVLLYCTLVYVFKIRKVLASKKHSTSNIKTGSTMFPRSIIGQMESREQLCDMYEYEMMQ